MSPKEGLQKRENIEIRLYLSLRTDKIKKWGEGSWDVLAWSG